jgi:hypothetical protein
MNYVTIDGERYRMWRFTGRNMRAELLKAFEALKVISDVDEKVELGIRIQLDVTPKSKR